jgi:aminoglycoside/choline kinase family phosphotransferase
VVTAGRPLIVDKPEELTPDWLTSALTGSGTLDGERVLEVARDDIGTGQMCRCTRLTLSYDRPTEAPSSIVAKLPAASETSRSTAKATRSYENEVRFYQQLAPELPVRTPRVFHADLEVDSARFVLLLEDLAPGQVGDQIAGCSPELAEVAVDELVKLHAPRWGDAALADLEWLHGDKQLGRQFLLAMLPGLWDGFRQRYAARLGGDVLEAGSALFSRLDAYLLVDSEPWTVVHGDYRLDNLLFDPTPGGVPIAVVDWQTVTDGPALHDVAYFIGAGLRAEHRRAAEDGLVRRYHAGLVAAGVTGYEWDDCWHDYRRGTWSGLVMAVAASMLVERTVRGDEMFLTMAERHACHALELDAVAVIS